MRGLEAQVSQKPWVLRGNRLRWFLRLGTLGLGLALLWIAVRGVDPVGVLSALAGADRVWLALTVTLVMSGLLLKTIRWAVLLRPVAPDLGFAHIMGILLTGQAGNALLPARSGDALRVILATSKDRGRLAAVAAGIGIEKALDGIMLLVAVALVLPTLPAGVAVADRWRSLLAFSLGSLAAALLALALSPRMWELARPLAAQLPRAAGKWVVDLGDRFVSGMQALRTGGRFTWVFVLSVLTWLVMALTNLALAAALHLPGDWSLGLVVLVMAFVAVVPGLMPGQVGPFYYFVRLGLSAFGIGAALSAAYAILLHLMVMLPPIAGAGLYLILQHKFRPLGILGKE